MEAVPLDSILLPFIYHLIQHANIALHSFFSSCLQRIEQNRHQIDFGIKTAIFSEIKQSNYNPRAFFLIE